MTKSRGTQYPPPESEGPTVEGQTGSDDEVAGPKPEQTTTRPTPSVEADIQADGVQADGDGPGFQQDPTPPEPTTSTAEEAPGAPTATFASAQDTDDVDGEPTNSNVETADNGWTSLDRELLDAATDKPANILDLLNRGANVGVTSSNGTPLVILLVKNGLASDSAESVLQVLPEVLTRMTQGQVNATDREKTTALTWAVRGYSPGDVISTRFIIMKHLLDHRADPEVKDEDGCTALDWACRKGNTSIVKLLLANGANINVKDNSSWTPLKTAARFGHTDIVKELLDRGATVDVQDSVGWTALTCAARYDFFNVVLDLLRVGANPNLRNIDGRTPLSYACRHGFLESVLILLDGGADPNIPDKENWTPLAYATRYDFGDIVTTLLDKGANPNTFAKDSKSTPLASACKWGNESIVAQLLEAKADVKAVDDSGITPLHWAALYGHNTIVERLLRYRANTRSVDKTGEIPLHVAARQGYATVVKTLLEHQPQPTEVNAQDSDLETPLHGASKYTCEDVVLLINDEARCDTDSHCKTKAGDDGPGRFERVIELLYKHGADPTIIAGSGETALHMAARRGYDKRIKALLESETQHHWTLRNKEGKTALHIAAEAKHPDTVRQLLIRLKSTDWGTHSIEKQTLLWAAETESTHDIVGMVLRYCGRPHIDHISVDPHWPPLVLAAYHGDYQVSLALLRSASPLSADNKRRNMAEALVKKIIRIIEPDKVDSKWVGNPSPMGGEPGEGDQNTKVHESDIDTARRWSSQKANTVPTRAGYDQILDILLNPPRILPDALLVETSIGRAPYERPQLSKAVDLPRLNACVIDFYSAQDGGSGFLRRFRDVRDVVYGDGPKKIMESARGATQNLGETHAKQDLTFRWIHLPANNLQWMNDLALRIFIDENKKEGEYEDLRVFLRDSWHEILDGSVTSRYMKPNCASRLGKRWGGKAPKSFQGVHAEANPKTRGVAGPSGATRLGAGSDAGSDEMDKENTPPDEILDSKKPMQQAQDDKCQIALYMPYITFATQREDGAASEEYVKLLKCFENKNIVMHGSRTLDEFYYHFDEKDESEEKKRRNKDQVVTRELNKGGDVEKCASWTILRVEQLWLWVINDKYIITSSTHRVDDADDIVPSTILNYLSKDPLSRRARPQPASAVAMSKFIVDFCVGFFSHLQADAGPNVTKAEGRRSTRQLFSDAINRASIEEARLFRNFTDRSGKSASDDNRLGSIREAADLLRTVKDIRDELNILRVIVSHHKTVQAKLPVAEAHDDRHAVSVLRDIEELDKVAWKIEGAVNATLTLEQSAIAIAQSNEAVQQGRTMMAFTVVTILFLPISFLATVFALNIDGFQRRKDGDLSYTPRWIFPKIFGLSAVVWFPSLVWALYLDETKVYASRLWAQLVKPRPKEDGRRIARVPMTVSPRVQMAVSPRVSPRVQMAVSPRVSPRVQMAASPWAWLGLGRPSALHHIATTRRAGRLGGLWDKVRSVGSRTAPPGDIENGEGRAVEANGRS